MTNQETAELCEKFAVYKTAMAQMTDQGSKILFLPQEVELEKPKSLTGVIDTDKVNAVIFQVE